MGQHCSWSEQMLKEHILRWSFQQAVTFTSNNVCRDTRDTAASQNHAETDLLWHAKSICKWEIFQPHIRSVNKNMWSISMTSDFFYMDLRLSLKKREQLLFWVEISVVFLRWNTSNLLYLVQQLLSGLFSEEETVLSFLHDVFDLDALKNTGKWF